ncbi:glucoside xylosyltransferase 1 shams [Lycorma delicatula]|uniref:glucoside xylosyltransferase 1 shams n=1 Tax=Lycorma delicatula TaxID=130591 RepID=UPI003F50F12C
MKLKHRWLFFIVFILAIVYFVYYFHDFVHNHNKQILGIVGFTINNYNVTSKRAYFKSHSFTKNNIQKLPIIEMVRNEEIVLGVVVCGDRLTETLTMLKSAILFNMYTDHGLRIVIVTEDKLNQNFSEKLGEWKALTNNSFEFELHGLLFPTQYGDEWKTLFKPCAAQRLFLPTLLPHLDKMLYVDTDVIFLAPLTEVWDHFNLMNSTQMAALSPEHEDPNIGWYNRFARHPYYGKMGVNSGVMLMHLYRMRQFGWVKYLAPIYKEFRLKLTWGDQDIINIFFHFHPERLLVYSCIHNYRTDHCMYLSTCPPAERDGVVVVHGSRSSFHGEKQPAFRAIYRAMEEYQLMTDAYENLLLPMKSYLDQTSHTNCGKLRHVFTKHMYVTITPAPIPALPAVDEDDNNNR